MTSPFPDGQVAAADLGSNSFHLAVGEVTDGVLVLTDKIKDRVALAAGLDEARTLDEETQERALACLAQFGARLASIPSSRVRACGTNTLRAARNASEFIARAEAALGHPIEIIEGPEEARLVYRGVAWSDAPGEGTRLVMDIGGGSTEFVMGRGSEIMTADSLRMGCVTWSKGFFPGGGINEDRYQAARFAASLEVRSVVPQVRDQDLGQVLGSSGTLNAIGEILRACGWTDGSITPQGIEQLAEKLIACGNIEDLDVPGLSDKRRPVIVGGLAIADAAFRGLGLTSMTPVEGALREGMLSEMVYGDAAGDRRDHTVALYQSRLSVNTAQAARVRATLASFIEAAQPSWDLSSVAPIAGWAADLHEIGLFLRRAGYHKHGAYLLQNSDLPGFSRRSQGLLAALVLCHRRKFRHEALTEVARDPQAAIRAAALLRLAVRLCHGRSDDVPMPEELSVDGDTIDLRFALRGESAPLLDLDLRQERERLERAGLTLRWEL